ARPTRIGSTMRLERSPAAELRRYGQSRPFRASSLLFAATRGAFPRLRTVPGIGRGEQKRIKVRKIERRSEILRVLLNAGRAQGRRRSLVSDAQLGDAAGQEIPGTMILDCESSSKRRASYYDVVQ
ncbi:MAG TPA: hypothetical protein VFH74_13900, partial [Gaiellales bacterium]|nr:hypothetical protein [Gaiellales bacterium]